MSQYSIETESPPTSESSEAIVKGIVAYNTSQVGQTDIQRFVVVAKDEEGRVIGGVLAYPSWNWLFIQLFWVDEAHRGKGLGTALLANTEAEAITRGCEHVHLDTFSFQARFFYERFGYEVFGVLEDFPPGHSRFFMQKRHLK